MSTRKGYRFGVLWIALNDSAGDQMDIDDLAGLISTKLLADLFGKTEQQVAKDVDRQRNKHGLQDEEKS